MLSSGKLLWSHPVESESYVGTSGISDLVIADGFIRILDPQTEYIVQGKIDDRTSSLIFKFNPSDGTFGGSAIFGGVIFFSDYLGGNRAISIGSNDKTTLMVKQWKNEK